MTTQRPKTKFKTVTKAKPCAICGGDHKCSVGEDGLMLCGRESGEVLGFVFLGQCKADPQWSEYRAIGDPLLDQEDRRSATGKQQQSQHNGHSGNGHAPKDWARIAEKYAENFRAKPERAAQLASLLGVRDEALATVGTGYNRDTHGDHYTFPEHDGDGTIIGISRRYLDGNKMAMAGGKRGLIIPDGWEARGKDLLSPIFVVEGASDVLALTSLGLPSIGRPSNTGGAEQIAQVVGKLPESQRKMVAVLGEYDPKKDGGWPGKDGAVKVSAELAARLAGWPVCWAMPPDGKKDVREWVRAQKLDRHQPEAWRKAAERLIREFDTGNYYQPVSSTEESVRLEVVDSPSFAQADYPLVWLVKQVLVAQQPAIVGGPKKCLKTSALCDLAISMGAGLPFLGQFKVPQAIRTGFLSGESGPHTIQDTARNVCKAKGISLEQAGVWWGFALPQLSQDEHLQRLEELIKENELQAIILDPLYLCLLAGNPEAQAGNMFDMGPLLAKVATTCLGAGATPILAHHNVKRPPDPYAVPELEDLAFAGIQEFARQWLLVGRREKYELGSGQHRLWLNIGGSVGFSSCWAVDVFEGVVDDEFRGKTWEVGVASALEAIAANREAAEQRRTKTQEAKTKAQDAQVLNAIDELAKTGENSRNRVRELCGLSGTKMAQAVARLIAESLIEEFEIEVPVGRYRTGKQKAIGLRRKRN